MKNSTYNDDEVLFKKVNEMFANSSLNTGYVMVHFWGSLGDKKILSWDHDIDFAVWKDEVSIKNIEKLLKNGFKQELIFGEEDCLHFKSNTKTIESIVYDRKDGLASIKWIAPSNKIKIKCNILLQIEYASQKA